MLDTRDAETSLEAFLRFGLAAYLGSLKGTKRATERCRSRHRRLLKSLTPAVQPINPAMVKLARQEMKRACAACGKCPGA